MEGITPRCRRHIRRQMVLHCFDKRTLEKLFETFHLMQNISDGCKSSTLSRDSAVSRDIEAVEHLGWHFYPHKTRQITSLGPSVSLIRHWVSSNIINNRIGCSIDPWGHGSQICLLLLNFHPKQGSKTTQSKGEWIRFLYNCKMNK